MSIYFLRRPKHASVQESKPKVDMTAITAMYEQFHFDEEEDIIGPDGIEEMCKELGINPMEDIEILIIAWHFKAKTGSQFSKEEFQNGMVKLGCENLQQLKEKLPELRAELDIPSKFREFFRFVFQISREGTAKTIEKEIIITLLRLVLGSRSVHTNDFCEFLESSPVQRITFDQWSNFLEFSTQVSANLEGYDPSGAWPLLLDEFVEWKQSKTNSEHK